MNNFVYSFPTKVIFNRLSIHSLADELKIANKHKPLVVTDETLVTLPVFDQVVEPLKNAKISFNVFSGIAGNPLKSQVEAGAKAFKESSSDSIIAVGGGAALDVAKCIGVLDKHTEDLFEYEDIPGALPIDKEIPFTIAIPTTTGTGSEVGRSAVVSDDRTKIKKIIFAPTLLPSVVILDPELTINLPASVTASTGMDAITHLVEAYIAKGYNPLCDAIALHGLRLASKSLKQCFDFVKAKTGSTNEHLKARGDMLHASMMGAIAFQKGLGVTHSLAHSLSTVENMHHGLANAIMINIAMRYNQGACESKFEDIEQALGLEKDKGNNFIAWLEKTKKDLEIPENLKAAGVTIDKKADLVKYAYADICHTLNPITVTETDFENLYNKSL